MYDSYLNPMKQVNLKIHHPSLWHLYSAFKRFQTTCMISSMQRTSGLMLITKPTRVQDIYLPDLVSNLKYKIRCDEFGLNLAIVTSIALNIVKVSVIGFIDLGNQRRKECSGGSREIDVIYQYNTYEFSTSYLNNVECKST